MPSHARIIVVVAVLLSLLVASPTASAVATDLGVDAPVGTVAAQSDDAGGQGAGAADEAGEEEEEEEGGIEGAISGFIEAQGNIGAAIVLLGGILLLTACTEKLISYLARASINTNLSLFALAIVFTGFEFDDTILALVLSGGGLEQAALGSALGTGLAIIGVTLALAAIVKPFPVDLPNDYIVIFGLAPLILVPFAMLGSLTLIHGLVLTAFFVFAFGYFIVRERQRDIPVFRDTELGKELQPDGGVAQPHSLEEIPEDRILGNLANSGVVWIGLAVVALAGIVFAAMLLEGGSEVVIEGFGIEETVFGATFLTLILTFEDIMLTLEPVRRGFPEIGVGNVIGSVLFSVTGNIGVVMFLSDVTISPSVLTFHLPAMIIMTALAAYFFYTKNVQRWHGFVLGGLYVAYWVISLVVLSGVPVGE